MMAEGFVENGAKVYIVGRRREVLDKTVEEVRGMFKGRGGIYRRVAFSRW